MKPYPTALVLGLADSGEAAARLLAAEGTRVEVMDRDDRPDLRRRAAGLEALGVRVRLGQSDLPSGPYAVCVVSPGIPPGSGWIREARARGLPVIAELELGWSRASGRVLAVTGSNGKSSLVKLCAETLALGGRTVALAGNCGPPVSEVVRGGRALDWLVLEVSSFQLETVRGFRPDVGVLLNVLPNHLERHGDLAAYRRIKSRIFAGMRPDDIGVLPEDLTGSVPRLAASSNRWLTFGMGPDADFRYGNGQVMERAGPRTVPLGGTPFANDILGPAAAAAAAALAAAGESLEALARAARAFQPLPHRMQEVAVRRQVRFVDDSKATNLAAMVAGLRMSPAPVRLIAGGLPKGESYEPARPILAEKVAAIYLIGAAAETMNAAWSGVAPCRASGTLDRAVRQAWAEARPGDTILLAPACASFDQFRDFAERGRHFAELARALAGAAG